MEIYDLRRDHREPCRRAIWVSLDFIEGLQYVLSLQIGNNGDEVEKK